MLSADDIVNDITILSRDKQVTDIFRYTDRRTGA